MLIIREILEIKLDLLSYLYYTVRKQKTKMFYKYREVYIV